MSQADWDRLQYYSRKVQFFSSLYSDDPKVHPSTYIQIAQLQSSVLFPSLRRLLYHLSPNDMSISLFLFVSPLLYSLEFYNIKGIEKTIVGPFLATLSFQMLSRIVLHNRQMSADILKKFFVHSKQLRSLELLNAVFMSDFGLLEIVSRLPSLENFTLDARDPASHPAHAPENSNSQSGDRKHFDALESLSITGSFFFIQHLLSFIDSACLKLIDASPVIKPVRNGQITSLRIFLPPLWR